MRIWYDACTGKHLRYGSAICKRLKKNGHQIIFTTRKHPDTIPIARLLDEEPIVVGEYKPYSLFDRLEESSKRIIKFSKMFRDNPPDIAIAHQSVELCRTAFGLGIPIILTADTPHAIAVNRLTIPLAAFIVASKAIPPEILMNYNAKKIAYFDGVDEIAWIENLTDRTKPKSKKPLIIIRQLETKAVYVKDQLDFSNKIVKKLKTIGDVIFLRRYNKKEFIDTANLFSQADLVISAGGTISREASLHGVPSVILGEIGKTYVNEYLAEKGFPLFFSKSEELLINIDRYIKSRKDVSSILKELENPVDTIEKIVKGLSLPKKD
jgi:predicted glycosyltransferase